ncbi:uncharacterized protein SPAPADRAFT_136690 [Spathaspora passalidarum NRRL Y-27907]|uniref:Uncharacterized protein n=1 Tax=Spathaspora passalidarum (strain NRRL Y-27907 / 11-Y1) TaxID=619300 RepID=G3AKS6_SPAPN|nr:uncharacterized protein SPAPADRAFT_136690 [Spathaspora passalidarum NRRL Y-27907]EGW32980.1 hypothetical protein SPAPADRAFT_136690 [Spathaspora passalidarum NRRL Y-27907]
MLILLVWLVRLIVALPDSSQSCITNKNIPFTGYKIEYQLRLNTFQCEYHMIYCNDNKLIYDMNLNDTIPWTHPIHFSKTNRSNTLILARRKSFALRCIPIYLPNTLVGSLYYNPTSQPVTNNTKLQSVPLVAANIHRSWIEMNYKLEFTYHVPLLTTPGIDSRRFQIGMFKEQNKNNWNEYISITESYDFKYDSRIVVRKAIDRVLTQINLLINTSKFVKKKIDMSNISKRTSRVFWKLVMLSKVLKHETFDMILVKIDKFLQY